jgi:transposase
VEKKTGRAREFGENLKMLFRVAMGLREGHHAGVVADYTAKVAEVQFILSYLLRPRTLKDPDN